MEDEQSFRQRCQPRAAFAVIGGALVHFALGSYYTFGNMTPYIMSYLRIKAGQTWVHNVDSLWISSLSVLPGPFIPFLAGYLERRFGCRIATAAGCLVLTLGNALTYFAIQKSLFLVVLTYGVCCLSGLVMAYLIPLQNATRWFPRHQSFVIGVTMCGFGGSAAILNKVITGYINPDNLSPDLITDNNERYFTNDELLDRVPKTFLILTCIYAVVSTLGIALLFTPNDIVLKQKEIEVEEPDEEEVEPLFSRSTDTTDTIDITYKDTIKQELLDEINLNSEELNIVNERPSVKTILLTMLKNRNSYVVCSVVFFIFAGMQYNITLYKAYGQTFISDDSFLALVGSAAAIFNCLGRPFWGWMLDKYGFKVAMLLLTTCFVCIMTTLPYTEKLGKVAFMAWISLSYGVFCGIMPMFPSMMAKLYGKNYMIINTSLVYVALVSVYLTFYMLKKPWDKEETADGITPMSPSTMAKMFGKDHMIINMCVVFGALFSAEVFGGLTGLALKDTIGWHGMFLMCGFFGAIAFISTFFFDGKDEDGKDI